MPARQALAMAGAWLLAWAAGPAWAATDLAALFERAGVAPAEERLVAPDFALPALSGETVRLGDFAGRLVVVNFWATWCRPCIQEMPALDRLQARLREDGLTVLAVSLDMGPRRDVAEFAAGYGFRFPILLDPLGEVGELYAVRVMPTTYLVGPDGTILGRSFGALAWDGPDAVALMQSLLRFPEPPIQ